MLVKDEVLLEALKAARHDAPKPVEEVKSDVAETPVVPSEPITEKSGTPLRGPW